MKYGVHVGMLKRKPNFLLPLLRFAAKEKIRRNYGKLFLLHFDEVDHKFGTSSVNYAL